jgi:hypothetical protein
MSHSLHIAVWNANGLSQHRNELEMFLLIHNIDILLISEIHFTSKGFFRLPHYRHISGEPIYWPTDRNKLSDLVDFCITKGISPNYVFAKFCFELSSDNTPFLITLSFETTAVRPTPVFAKRKPTGMFSSSSH